MWVVAVGAEFDQSLNVLVGAGVNSHTTARLDYQLISITCCRGHCMFHCHLSLLDQVLSWPIQVT